MPADPGLSAPEPLSDIHELSTFTCGKPAFDDWLRRRALDSEARTARSYVVCAGRRVVGYYCLAAGAVMRNAAPGRLRKNAPGPIPVIVLGRLAVDRAFQGRGIGSGLLRDAILRAVAAAHAIGVRAILVHTLDDEATRFYGRYGFLPSPIDPRTLMLPIDTAIAALR